MEALWHDLKYALRLFGRERGFTAICVLTLAVCIGANTAIFSVLYSQLLKPLPFPGSERLVAIYNEYPFLSAGKGANSVPDFFDRRALTHVFTEVALIGSSGASVGADGIPERVNGLRVTPSLFPLLGVKPIQGRAFDEEEMDPGRTPVVILGESLWRNSYGGDPEMVGRDILLGGRTHRVVGIMPASFRLLDRQTSYLVAFAPTAEQRHPSNKHANSWSMIARLAPGVSIAQARKEIDALNVVVLEREPEFRDSVLASGYRTQVMGLVEHATSQLRMPLLMLQAGVLVVLVIGCVNIASLMLSRASARAHELGIRFSLGAERMRVFRQLLTESMALAAAGGLLGLLLGSWGTDLITQLWGSRIPRGAEVEVDILVFLFTSLLTAGSGVIAGGLPAFHLARSAHAAVVQRGGRSATAGPGTIFARNALVVFQVSLAFVLLIATGLLVRSFNEAIAVHPGFRMQGVETAAVSLPSAVYEADSSAVALIEGVLARARSIPGVTHASVSSSLPFGGSYPRSVVTFDGRLPGPGEAPPAPAISRVDADYFASMEIPSVSGRLFRSDDVAGRPLVALIDRVLAERHWPGVDPVGHTITEGFGREPDDRVFTIIGVVGEVKERSLLEEGADGAIYIHALQDPPRNFWFVLRTTPGAGPVMRSLQNEILEFDPQLPLFDLRPLERRVADSLADRHTPMVLLEVFAGVALLLSGLGIYGVLAFAVTQRRREIGIRIAIGARVQEVLSLFMRRGMFLVCAGLLGGFILASALTTLVASFLFGVGRFDPATLVGVTLVIAGVGALACYIPATRAARLSPLEVLRDE